MSQYTRLPASSTSVSLPASGAPGAAAPAQALQVGGTDGVNLRALSVSSAGVLDVAVASLPLPTGAATAANQATMIASLSSIDSKLTAPISVTGPLTDAQLRASAVPVSAASLPLPTGAATEAKQDDGNGFLANIDGALADTIVNIGSPIPVSAMTMGVSDSNGNISTLLLAQSGALYTTMGAEEARGNAIPNNAVMIGAADPSQNVIAINADSGGNLIVTGPLTDTQLRATAVPVSAASLPLPTGAATESTLSTLNGKIPSNLTVTSTRLLVDGSGVTQPVSGTVTATPPTASSSSVTSVSGSASSVSLLASNSSRKMATFYNDSTATLYLKLGTTASTTSYTVQLVAGAYYELPGNQVYTGAIDGIWASATGAVRITEIS